MTELNRNQFTPLSNRSLPLPARPKQWTEHKTRSLRHNYSQGYMSTPAPLLKAGADFYPTWHEDAQHLADAAGVHLGNTAAMIAHLSPSNEAELNRIQGFQMIHDTIHNDRAFSALLEMGQHAHHIASAQNKQRNIAKQGGTGSKEHLEQVMREADHRAALDSLRQQSGLHGTPLGGVGARELTKAAHALILPHEQAMASLGVKTGDFGGQIHDPWNYPKMTVDTHFHDAGVGRFNIPYKHDPEKGERELRGLSAVGRYRAIQGNSEAARQHVQRTLGQEIEPAAFMGGVWYGHQQRKAEANPASRRTRQTAATRIANITSQRQFQHFLPQTHGRPAAIQRIEI